MRPEITIEELEEIISSQLASCLPEDAHLFAAIRMAPKKMRLTCGSHSTDVLAVGVFKGKVLYYDDVEEAFEVATPDADDVIRTGGVGQFQLCHALAQLRIGGR